MLEKLKQIYNKYQDYVPENDGLIECINFEPQKVHMNVYAPMYLAEPRTTVLTFDQIKVAVVYKKVKVALINTKNAFSTISLTLSEVNEFIEELEKTD
jgi:hypothetical protein